MSGEQVGLAQNMSIGTNDNPFSETFTFSQEEAKPDPVSREPRLRSDSMLGASELRAQTQVWLHASCIQALGMLTSALATNLLLTWEASLQMLSPNISTLLSTDLHPAWHPQAQDTAILEHWWICEPVTSLLKMAHTNPNGLAKG